jgi:hypothetical protein
MSEVIDEHYYTNHEARKSPPKNKVIIKAMTTVDAHYYEHQNKENKNNISERFPSHHQSVNEMLLSRRQRTKIFSDVPKAANTERSAI